MWGETTKLYAIIKTQNLHLDKEAVGSKDLKERDELEELEAELSSLKKEIL